jgi:hypothetical protein
MVQTSREATAAGEDAVHATVAAWYATERLQAESLAYVHHSFVPSLVLWVGAWRPLPEIVRWLAVLAWSVCAVVAAVLGVAAVRRRRQLADALPGASRVVRFPFAPAGGGLPAASELLVSLSVAASVLLWIHAWAPRLLSSAVVATAATCWLFLLLAAAGNKYLERR